MAVPSNREQFKQWCLRKLGRPVIEINLADEQIDDRIDEAIQYYWNFAFDGSEKTYYKYQIQPQDIVNRYITLPPNIIGAVSIFPYGDSLSTNNLFNIRYQITLNDLYDLTATTMVPYYMAMQHIQLLEQLLVGQQPIRFNRYNNLLYIDMGWDMVVPGNYLIVEAYQVVDPAVYTAAWADTWLQRYATALIKKNWGEVLGKYTEVALPGGMKFSGERIYNDAVREVEKLEEEMRTTWAGFPLDMIG